MTQQLLKFWKRAGYVPYYLRQTENELTGECTCVMLKSLGEERGFEGFAQGKGIPIKVSLLVNDDRHGNGTDFRRRFLSLLSYKFREFPSVTALSVLEAINAGDGHKEDGSQG